MNDDEDNDSKVTTFAAGTPSDNKLKKIKEIVKLMQKSANVTSSEYKKYNVTYTDFVKLYSPMFTEYKALGDSPPGLTVKPHITKEFVMSTSDEYNDDYNNDEYSNDDEYYDNSDEESLEGCDCSICTAINEKKLKKVGESMEEIVYFDMKNESNIKNVLPEYFALISNEKLKKCGIHYPYTYFLTHQEILDLDSSSVKWPISLKVLRPGEVYAEPAVVEKIKDLHAMATEENKDAMFLISIPYAENTTRVVYFAKDYCLAHNTSNNDVHILNIDNTMMFDHFGFNKDIVYRIIPGTAKWVIDNLIPYEDPRLDVIHKQTIDTFFSDAEAQKAFVKNYKIGFGVNQHPTCKMWEHHLSENAKIADPEVFGYMIGVMLRSQIVEIVNSNAPLFNIAAPKKDALNLFALLGTEEAVSYYKKLATLHNNIISGNLNSVKEEFINTLFTSSCATGSWGVFTDWNNSTSFMLQQKQNVDNCGKAQQNAYAAQAVALPIVEKIDGASLSYEISASNLQVRITESDSSCVKLRVQAKPIAVKAKIEGKKISTPVDIMLLNHSSAEVDFGVSSASGRIPSTYPDIAAYYAALNSLTYDSASQAGTSAMYAPLMISGDNIVETKTGTVVFTCDSFISALKKRGYIKNDVISQMAGSIKIK